MSQILGEQNISFPDFHRDNEVCMALNVVEENVYLMSPALALLLAAKLEAAAKAVIETQESALHRYNQKKAGLD